ncbi:hypothetical protein [Sphingobium sp.]|uniref:hypothetical protein n=1 Tax=Sphingobium sp. TaxID=1912891 RepID=UPI0026037997|nr:hypothetical protein [Sphingobium sp.]
MFDSAFSLPVVGADGATARNAERRAEIVRARPGDPLTLRREHGKRGGLPMVGVYSERGVQMGYIWPDRSQEVAGLVAVARAIYRSADAFGCVIHITVDGSTPTLPPPYRRAGRRVDPPAAPPHEEFGSIFPLAPRGHAYAIGAAAKRTYKADLRHSDKSLYPAGGRA